MRLVLGIPGVCSLWEIPLEPHSGHSDVRLWDSEEFRGQIRNLSATRRKPEPHSEGAPVGRNQNHRD